jgi:O-antigen/teichoic acid export membrane protein
MPGVGPAPGAYGALKPALDYVAAALLLVLAAPLLLLPFGRAYVEHGTTLLRLLIVATVPQAAIALYLGVERVRARIGRVAALEGAIVVLVTAGAVFGMRSYGLPGLGVAWLAAQSAMAVLVVPALRKVCHRPVTADAARRAA